METLLKYWSSLAIRLLNNESHLGELASSGGGLSSFFIGGIDPTVLKALKLAVYRLVAANTIEEKIVALHHQKRDLADSLLEGTETSARVSAEDLMALLRDEWE